MRRAKTVPRHDRTPDSDDVRAWIVIALIAAGSMLVVWLLVLKPWGA